MKALSKKEIRFMVGHSLLVVTHKITGTPSKKLEKKIKKLSSELALMIWHDYKKSSKSLKVTRNASIFPEKMQESVNKEKN